MATNGLARVRSSSQLAPAFSGIAKELSTAAAMWETVAGVNPASAVSRVSATDSAVVVAASSNVPAMEHTEHSVEMSMRVLLVFALSVIPFCLRFWLQHYES